MYFILLPQMLCAAEAEVLGPDNRGQTISPNGLLDLMKVAVGWTI